MTTLQLRASDGNTLAAYVVKPEGTPRGAVVVVQEIFGVNSHVRRVVEQYAAEGYVAIAPAMFDRFQKDVDLGYDAKGLEQGVAFMMRTTNASTLADLTAAAHLSCIDYIGDVPWAHNESAKTWYARIKSRPSFRSILADTVPGIAPVETYANLDF